FDPDATVALPVIPPTAPPVQSPGSVWPTGFDPNAFDPNATVLLPTVPAGPPPESPPQSPVSPPPAQDDATGSVARSSATMAVGSIVSRVTGFLRTAAIGAAIGSAA